MQQFRKIKKNGERATITIKCKREGLKIMRPFYADYVNHMLRFYCRGIYIGGGKLKPRKSVELKNISAISEIFNNLPEWDRNVIIKVYERGDTLADNIYWIAKEEEVKQDVIWTLIRKVTKQIAKERELI